MRQYPLQGSLESSKTKPLAQEVLFNSQDRNQKIVLARNKLITRIYDLESLMKFPDKKFNRLYNNLLDKKPYKFGNKKNSNSVPFQSFPPILKQIYNSVIQCRKKFKTIYINKLGYTSKRVNIFTYRFFNFKYK